MTGDPAPSPVDAIRATARAKVNLYLHVVGRRPDGLHLLDSLVVFADIGDALVVRPAADLTLAIDGPFAAAVPAGDDNLVLRAARLLRQRDGAAIGLTKRLPVAAGLGGGSADAAAALRALGRLWRLHSAPGELARLGLELGADLPVCLAGGPRFVGGVGDDLAPVPALPPAHLVLVNPGVKLPTAAVYGARAGAFSAPARWREAPADAATLARRLAACGNDLTAAARRLAPPIDAVLTALAGRRGCLVARLSGSGATCFGLFAAAVEAEAAAAALAAAQPSWWVAAAPMLTADLAWPAEAGFATAGCAAAG